MTAAVVRITRERHYRGAGRLHPFGFLYRLNGDHAVDNLAQARSMARRLYPGARVIETWKEAAK